MKHAIFDGDLTMARMTSGAIAGPDRAPRRTLAPLLAALAIFAAGAVGAWQLASTPAAKATEAAPTEAPSETTAETTAGNWQVTEGTLAFTARQMGANVNGSFPAWTAEIDFDETTGTGKVSVQIDMASTTLGSVTDQAKGPEFFDVTKNPTATFTADITPAATGQTATGTLTLRGAAKPVTLPFTLTITGDTATMTGTTTLDRRDFGIGPSYKDEATVGFAVDVSVSLTAQRKP